MLYSITVDCQVYGHNPVSEAEAVSIRRALRSLAQAGKITDLGRGGHSGRGMRALPEQAST